MKSNLISKIVICMGILAVSCSNPEEKIEINPAFGEYVFAYTSGIISTSDPIIVKLAQPYSGPFQMSEALPDNILRFDPAIDGQTSWLDNQTLKFIPAKRLPGGSFYTGMLDLQALIGITGEMATFKFQFQTIEQHLSVYLDGLDMYDPNDLSRVKLKGRINMADAVSISDLESGFQARQGEADRKVKIEQLNATSFSLIVEDIVRGEKRNEVLLSWNIPSGKQSLEGAESYQIPAIGEFEIMNVTVLTSPESAVRISFSDPIQKQNLDGLITIEGMNSSRFMIDGNVVTLFPEGKATGQKLLRIDGSVKNLAGKPLGNPYTETIAFELIKPGVRLLGKKNIIPVDQKGLLFPFEAVSLQGVDVYITKIFTNNILQYFQGTGNSEYYYEDDDYYDSYSLSHVGRQIFRKHVDLRQAGGLDLHQWNRYHIDLSEIFKADPGAYYEIDIRFRQEDAVYICDGDLAANNEILPKASQGWISDGTYFVDDYWNDYEYDWDNRENPCYGAYYSPYQHRAKSIISASGIGLTAKKGGDNKLLIVANNLQTTAPIKSAKIVVYDYQQQVMGEKSTDANGFAVIDCPREPFAVKATSASGVTYLKVDQGSALSLSKFDVSGSTVQDGIKGFIYAERGVWRPGDSLYLNFILEDADKVLPKNHPVKMELFNPQGRLVTTTTKTSAMDGMYDFRTRTNTEAPTGDYRATVTIGNRSYSKGLKIETVQPNRLKINFTFDPIKAGANELRGKIQANWLHGGAAPNLKADIAMSLRAVTTKFKGFDGYHFDNSIIQSFSTQEKVVFENALDSEGRADLRIDLKDQTAGAPGMLKAAFSTKVFEPGGQFSVDFHSFDFAPYASFAGLKLPESELWGDALETDKSQTFQLASLTAEGKPSANKSLTVKVFRVDRRWWYDRYNGTNYNYLTSSNFKEIESKSVAVQNGKATYTTSISKGNYGSYLIHVEDPVSGHSTAKFVYFDWPYWMRANRTDSEASAILGFSSDKETYALGEKAKLSFPSPENGRALVCIENGTRVLEKYWVETQVGETHFEFTTTSEMAPNIFAHISLFQPHGQTTNDRPIRMYGVVPIKVENPNSRLKPIITTAEVWRPETTASISVKEENGRPMTYTLAVVDEGLLGLTRFQTPNPWDEFYAPEALGVKTWDMYDAVIGAFADGMGNILSIGGDDNNLDPSKQKAARFKPMVRHLGPFSLAAGKSAKHEINIPNYIGAVRVMVVAAKDEAYGNASKEIPVRSPVMVLGTLPRVLGPGERVSLPVNVFAMEKDVKSVDISVTSNDLLQIVGESKRNLKFAKTGEDISYFELKTGNKAGKAVVKIEARSGSHLARYDVEIEVMARNPRFTTVRDTVLAAGASWTGSYALFGLDGTNEAAVEWSKMPAINLTERLDYLIGYPHGCVEQVTSRAFPQVYLDKLVDLSADRKVEIENNIKAALQTLRNFQRSDGGFSYWPGSQSDLSDWGTNYAGHFMLEAERKGYAIPPGLKSQWIKHQKSASRKWSGLNYRNEAYSQRTQAYRLFGLARAGEADFGAMNQMKGIADIHISARWILALAYAEAGQKEVARSLVAGRTQDMPAYTELSFTYGSGLRDEGFVLLTLIALDMETDAALLARKMAEALGKNSRYSTQTLAFSLAAITHFAGFQKKDEGLKLSFAQNGKTRQIATGKNLVVESLSTAAQKGTFTVKNESNSPLYGRLLISGQPVEAQEQRLANNLRLEVNYLDENFNPIAIDKLKRGSDFIVQVKVVNPNSNNYLREMALTQIFPSGWEILNARMSETTDLQGGQIQYQDIRDDRVMTYFDLPSGKTITFQLRVNASYAGRYYLPAVTAGAMYDANIRAVAPGQWVEIIR